MPVEAVILHVVIVAGGAAGLAGPGGTNGALASPAAPRRAEQPWFSALWPQG